MRRIPTESEEMLTFKTYGSEHWLLELKGKVLRDVGLEVTPFLVKGDMPAGGLGMINWWRSSDL